MKTNRRDDSKPRRPNRAPMRTIAILLASMFVLLGAFSTTASASHDCDKSRDVDATLVKVHVEYDVVCASLEVSRCTLYSDPEYPSHPYWRCERVL